jgi:hypothetical protein
MPVANNPSYLPSIALVRDIKIGISNGDYKVSIDTNKLPNLSFYLFKRKIVKDILDRGIILTGSRALVCYKVNGRYVFNRNPNDWDFVVNTNQFLEICRDYNIYDFDLTRSQYLLNRSLATFHTGYGGESHLFPCFIQLIIKDELQPYNEVNGIRFATLESILESKLDICRNSSWDYPSDSKHQRDINNIIVNTYSL